MQPCYGALPGATGPPARGRGSPAASKGRKVRAHEVLVVRADHVGVEVLQGRLCKAGQDRLVRGRLHPAALTQLFADDLLTVTRLAGDVDLSGARTGLPSLLRFARGLSPVAGTSLTGAPGAVGADRDQARYWPRRCWPRRNRPRRYWPRRY